MNVDESYNVAEWPDHVPDFVRKVLVVGCGSGVEAARLKERLDIEVYGVEPEPASVACVRKHLDGVVEGEWGGAAFPLPNGYFDSVVLTDPAMRGQRLEETLVKIADALNPNGILFALRDGLTESKQEEFETRVVNAGWGVYGATTHFVFVVKPTYNPVEHARALFDAGLPALSYDVLAYVPVTYYENPVNSAVLSTEMLVSLLAWDAQAGSTERLDRFTSAQTLFHRAVSRLSEAPGAYQCMAEFWRRIGNPGMAARLLRSIQHIAPTTSITRQLEALGPVLPSSMKEFVPLAWEIPSRVPRILFVTHPRPNYELDVLYDGLCTVLGDENVVEFPWKPTLHGHVPEELSHYPCLFDRPGRSRDIDEVCAELEAGRFDFVLYGDTERGLDQETARRLVASAREIPLSVVDGADDPGNNLRTVLDHLGIDSVRAYFKREMLACVTYSPNTYPLPFAYADGRIPNDVSGDRPEGLFWAGHRSFGTRRLYLDYLERQLSKDFNVLYLQDEYVTALAKSQVGLNLFGGGFDTVRYWELPAHGCMLLSERLPIHIPLNFQDGVSAVFFDDLPDLDKKLTYFLAHPDESHAIAMAGHEHLKRHHTGSARARHLLGWLQSVQPTG